MLNAVSDFTDFGNCKYPSFTDAEKITEISFMIDEIMVKLPKGSPMPVILISNDMNEFEYAASLQMEIT